MGISVPIGAEHYDKLKVISEKLGLGLKKTIEYLVSYYWQQEMNGVASKAKDDRPTINELRDDKPIIQSTEIKPIKQLLEELSKEYGIQSSIEVTSTSLFDPLSVNVSNSSTIKEDPAKIKPDISFLQNKDETCLSCGSPKRPNAKFCHNCGKSL